MAIDPRASRDVVTYTYPEPLDKPAKNFDGTDADRSHMINPEVAEDSDLPWIKVRVPKSKADLDKIADLTASIMVGAGDEMAWKQRIAGGNRNVFELLCEGWSFKDQFGMDPNATEFGKLDKWAGDWITACVADAMAQGTDRDYAKKTKSSLTSPETSPDESFKPEVTVTA